MQSQRIRLTALLFILATIAPTFSVNLAAKALAEQTLTQTTTAPTRLLAFHIGFTYVTFCMGGFSDIWVGKPVILVNPP